MLWVAPSGLGIEAYKSVSNNVIVQERNSTDPAKNNSRTILVCLEAGNGFVNELFCYLALNRRRVPSQGRRCVGYD